jgi:hypothetical protein
MIVYKDESYKSFVILGTEVNLITDETCYGRSTVAEIQNVYHHLGDQDPDITTALQIWKIVFNRTLTPEETVEVMMDNYIDNLVPDILGE